MTYWTTEEVFNVFFVDIEWQITNECDEGRRRRKGQFLAGWVAALWGSGQGLAGRANGRKPTSSRKIVQALATSAIVAATRIPVSSIGRYWDRRWLTSRYEVTRCSGVERHTC